MYTDAPPLSLVESILSFTGRIVVFSSSICACCMSVLTNNENETLCAQFETTLIRILGTISDQERMSF